METIVGVVGFCCRYAMSRIVCAAGNLLRELVIVQATRSASSQDVRALEIRTEIRVCHHLSVTRPVVRGQCTTFRLLR